MPSPLKLDDLLDRNRLAASADKIHKQKTNLVAEIATREGPMVIKLFGWRRPFHFWLGPFIAGRARTSWNVANALAVLGVGTPAPRFVFTRRRWGFIRENLYISAGINPHQTFRAFLKSEADPQNKRNVAIVLAKNLAKMHNGGIMHRDLTSGNFLVDEDGAVYLIDLNRSLIRKRLSGRQRAQDLARISFATDDAQLSENVRQAFFQSYAESSTVTVDWLSSYTRRRAWRLRRKQIKDRLRRLLNAQ